MITRARPRGKEPARSSPHAAVSLPHLRGWLTTAFPPTPELDCDICEGTGVYTCLDCEGTGTRSGRKTIDEPCDACGGKPREACAECVIVIPIAIVLGLYVARDTLLATAQSVHYHEIARIERAKHGLRMRATLPGAPPIVIPTYVPHDVRREDYVMRAYAHEQLPLKGVA